MGMNTASANGTKAHRKDHIVRFYDDDSFLCAMVARFLLEGHAQGTSSVVIATHEHRLGIEQALEEGGLDVSAAKRDGRLTLLDAEATLLEFTIGGLDRGVLDPKAFHDTVGSAIERALAASPSRSARAFGEMVDLLLRRGNESAMVHLEDLWNDLRSTYPFELYCSYRLSNLDRVEDQTSFEKICRLHTHVLPAESYD